jgi:hypothetical protein
MPSTPSKRVRWALALALGVPGTAVYLPLAALMAFAGFSSAADALQGGPWNYSPPPNLQQGVLYLAWGLAGTLGLLAFWIWVLQPRWLKRPGGKWLVATLLLAGVGSMLPVAAALLSWPPQFSVWSVLALLGILAGLLVLYHHVLSVPGAA